MEFFTLESSVASELVARLLRSLRIIEKVYGACCEEATFNQVIGYSIEFGLPLMYPPPEASPAQQTPSAV